MYSSMQSYFRSIPPLCGADLWFTVSMPTLPVAACRPRVDPIRMKNPNPLTAEWTGPYGGLPPWDKVEPQHFPEAFESAIDAWRAEIAAITQQADAPTFDNTIVPLEDSARMLERVATLFSVMTSN